MISHACVHSKRSNRALLGRLPTTAHWHHTGPLAAAAAAAGAAAAAVAGAAAVHCMHLLVRRVLCVKVQPQVLLHRLPQLRRDAVGLQRLH